MMANERLRVVRDGSGGASSGGEAEAAAPGPDVSRALLDLISRFDGFIRRTASRHGLRGADLDDVVQDLRVRIWKSFGTSEAIRRAKPAYMYRAAVSASLDIIRRRRTRTASNVAFDEVAAVRMADRGVTADEMLAVRELSRAVHESLNELPESRRAVVRMYLAGYDRLEIADLLGWTEGKTRNLLYRGLDDLRVVLRARGITGGTHD